MLENRPHLKLKNNATSFSDIFQSKQNWACYVVFVKTDDAPTMPGYRTPFSFSLCISFKSSPKQQFSAGLWLYTCTKVLAGCQSRSSIFLCWPITGLEKCTERKERERIDIMKTLYFVERLQQAECLFMKFRSSSICLKRSGRLSFELRWSSICLKNGYCLYFTL